MYKKSPLTSRHTLLVFPIGCTLKHFSTNAQTRIPLKYEFCASVIMIFTDSDIKRYVDTDIDFEVQPCHIGAYTNLNAHMNPNTHANINVHLNTHKYTHI